MTTFVLCTERGRWVAQMSTPSGTTLVLCMDRALAHEFEREEEYKEAEDRLKCHLKRVFVVYDETTCPF